jgi:hypothetical protein
MGVACKKLLPGKYLGFPENAKQKDVRILLIFNYI